MGLDIHGVKLVLLAKRLGVSPTQTAMIGRHTLHLSAAELHSLMASFGYDGGRSAQEMTALFNRNHGYAEPFLEALGAESVRSFDVSAYENATDIHDLNQPLPDKHKQQFSLVLEGGTLEHVFNFPEAIRSCMDMLAVGGHFVGIVPANNFLGHGFYQFSPELFFRLFSAANGFEMVKMVVYEDPHDAQWYQVNDPEPNRQRVELVNDNPTCLGIIARKIATLPLFRNGVYQSDYVNLWQSAPKPGIDFIRATGRKYMSWVPTWLRVAFRSAQRQGVGLSNYNPKFYTKIDVP